MCRTCQYTVEKLAASGGTLLPVEMAKPLIPMLVNGTKEKNQVVRSSAEMALIAMLQLKEGDQGSQVMLGALEAGGRDSLNEVITRSLRRATYISVTAAEIDPTLLT
ncbi:eIF-2-alpha kinase activator GCN1 [Chionoecetes opilio]|uniref:eIF-2-alpha kinase activator GCN1 n=1 Tax=Chionoecetes opilio TaxID=41210 RepID=A0A8J5CQZ6_CHIOP|nr:eIF-2-alpha kinase activator GCN1 [Chionoecetes opilio]